MSETIAAESAPLEPGLRKIRRRRWYLWITIIIYLPVMWLTLQTKPKMATIGTVFSVWFILLFAAALAAAAARCPRCGQYFHMQGMTLLFFRKCLHCQLHLKADKAR